MISMGEWANAAADLLQWLTVASATYAAWRHRDAHRLNIAAVVLAPIIAFYLQTTRLTVVDALGMGLALAQPYLLLRLVDFFQEVPRPVRALTVLGPLAVAIVSIASDRQTTGDLNLSQAVYLTVMLGYAAALFSIETRGKAGVTRMRLAFAAAASWLSAAGYVFVVLAMNSPTFSEAGVALTDFARALMTGCYFLAFATPRRLAHRWQRIEHSKYVSRTADRDVEERGRLAPDDLFHAVAGSVGNAAVAVAARDSPLGGDGVVKAASEPALRGVRIGSGSGAVGVVLLRGVPAFSTPAECEPELASSLARLGTSVLIAPISTSTHTWGAVVVAQRRGSLFPDDDLRLIAQLGRAAGTALDHAHLVAEARERERRAADRRLREAESRMSLLLDSIKDYAMFILDDHGKVVSWQTGAEHVFGYSAEEMTDESVAPLFDAPTGALEGWLKDARELGLAEREGQCRRKDGGRFIGASMFRPLADSGEGLSGFVGVTRDVTEHRDLEARLRQSQKLEAIGQLAGGIAHDFNNMLTAIIGAAGFLELQFADDDVIRPRVADILGSAQRAAGLTRQLLAFSRRQAVQPMPVNVSRVVAETLPMLRQVIGPLVAVVEDLGSETTAVLGDRSQIEQIVVNLVVNARDAMPTGGQLTIRTATEWVDASVAGEVVVAGQHVVLEVSDTGIGMDTETQARIFEPFFTTKEFGRGTGLGLSTVYGIVKQMSGMLRVISQRGMGSTFRVFLPVARVREAASTSAVPAKPPRGSETVLVVEDEAAVRSFLVDALQQYGYRVLAAENKSSALAIVDAHTGSIDLVIADVVMPGGTGPELVRALAVIRPGIPALYISGYADAVLAQEGSFPKASHFLQKPFTAADLLTRIRQILVRA
jgi:PAS domain S-box-containing protein